MKKINLPIDINKNLHNLIEIRKEKA